MSGFRILFALLCLVIALPCIFVFEGMSATTAIFLNRQTWYDMVAEPEVYEAAIYAVLPENISQHDTAFAAVPPAYFQAQLHKLIDYGFALLDNQTPAAPTFDIPAPLVPAIRENRLFAGLDTQEQPNGSLKLTISLSERTVNQLRQIGFQWAMATLVSAVLGFLLWFAAAWFAAETARGRLLWLGYTLIIASFGLVILGIAGIYTIIPNLQTELTYYAEQLTTMERTLFRSLLESVVPKLINAITFAGGIPCVIGILLVRIGEYLPRRRASGFYQKS